MIRTFLSLLVLLVTFGVLHAEDNEARIKAMFEAKKSTSYEAKAFKDVAPMEAGQWVMYGLTDDDEERSVMKCAIVAKNGDEITIETTMITEDDVIIMQFTVKGMDAAKKGGNLDGLDFVRIAIKTNDDEPMVLEGAMLSMMKGAYSSSIEGMVPTHTEMSDGGTQTVTAGTFHGTTKAKSSVNVTGDDEETTSWIHPAVPIYAMVRSQTSDEMTMELLDFGMTGAKPSF